MIELKAIKKSDHLFLYELLSERDLKENISHTIMPTFKQHVKFVMSKPYKKWYIIYFKNEKSGSIYLSKMNEIGIHFKKNIRSDKLYQDCIDTLISKNHGDRFLMNINPKNKILIRFAKNHHFKLIQYTYELALHK